MQPSVVVVGSGPEVSFALPDGPTEAAARRLARSLSLPHHPIRDPWAPNERLSRLQAAGEGWMASLPLDPGQPLPDGSTWAETLGAWQQPTLLIIGAQQLSSGAAASTTALLRQWGVPLLGLLQWGGPWSPEIRRRDGLPWLGWMEDLAAAESPSDTMDQLTSLLLKRWLLLDLPSPHPAGVARGRFP